MHGKDSMYGRKGINGAYKGNGHGTTPKGVSKSDNVKYTGKTKTANVAYTGKQ